MSGRPRGPGGRDVEVRLLNKREIAKTPRRTRRPSTVFILAEIDQKERQDRRRSKWG